MLRVTVAGAVLTMIGCALLSGCGATCGANPEKLAALRRGMNYEETSRIMGCPGTVVSPRGPLPGEHSTVEWSGPAPYLSYRTQIDFLDDKLLSYTTEQRGGW
jgi:hypothetical protein